MSLKKILSLLLVLTLALGVLAPCAALLPVQAATPLYGEAALQQVTDPKIGSSYYLAANVNGKLCFFRHGTVTETVPYSLVTTEDINHNWVFKLTLESSMQTSEKFEGGFQMTYTNPSSSALTRIYCYDVKTDGANKGVMDTGVNSGTAYKNRHSFFVDTVNGVKVLRKYGNNNVLVVKYDSTAKQWRMLGVPEAELANDGVYPAMLLEPHTHSYGEEYGYDENGHWHLCDCGAASETEKHSYVTDPEKGYAVCACGADLKDHTCVKSDGKWHGEQEDHYQLCTECGAKMNVTAHAFGQWTADTEHGSRSRTCSVCAYKQTLYGTETVVEQVEAPAIGESYYLAANVDGTLYYFRHGTVTETVPYSLVTTDNIDHNWAFPLTLESSTETGEKFEGGFQMTYKNPTSDALTRIYCYDVKTDGENKGVMDTGVNSAAPMKNRHSFFTDTVNGVKVLRKYGNDNVLVVKMDTTKNEWRMLGVPEAELANAGVYPAMLVTVHTHSFYTEYDENVHCRICSECGAKQDEEAHTMGDWVFNTDGTQDKTCTGCSYKQTIYGTEDKVEKVETPVIGESYYLSANVDGKIYYFRHGTVTDTTPYSLVTTDNIDHNWAFKVALESSTETDEKFEGGFQLTYTNPTNDTLTRIYCYDVKTDGENKGVMDTGVNSAAPMKNRHSFFMDTVNGEKVLRKYGNDNVLVVKMDTTKNEWRMLGVPEAELANEGVYPVMLANAHSHELSYEQDENNHRQVCDCGYETDPVKHEYVMDEQLGYGVCVCGADLKDHVCRSADGKWYTTEQGHYQLCAVCGKKMNEADHAMGSWVFNSDGTQDKTCSACGYKQTLYGTDGKVEKVDEPAVGESYYLAANVDGTVYYFRHGTVTDTTPYSLVTTDNIDHNWTFKVALESSTETDEKFEGGFQLTYTNPTNDTLTRIYCYDVKTDGENKGVMDTGVNTAAPMKNRHSFFTDTVNGEKVLRKYGSDNILVVKYDSAAKQWRMLGVPEAELANEGVYPVMLANAHTHDFGTEYGKDENSHWQVCECGTKTKAEKHDFVMDKKLGYEVCVCGADLSGHVCSNMDGKWYTTEQEHYQLCAVCGKKMNEADHTMGGWVFNSDGTQDKTCSACGYKQTLYGTGSKVEKVEAPAVGESYYLAANVDGTVYYFRHGSVTETVPYSLATTDNVNHNWAFKVALESSTETGEKFEGGFQLTYTNPTNDTLTRIYCYDVKTDGENKGVMDTGVNSAAPVKNRHSFFTDTVNGEKVLRKYGNNNILVVKYDSAAKQWRMLGVPEAELADAGVYPVMLANAHTHAAVNKTLLSDASGHWYACECGGKSDYAEHTVKSWKVVTEATQTAPGKMTGVCTVCGAAAVKETPAVVKDGYYYLTGTVDGTTYYFRDKTGKESVEDTAPFSLLTTNRKKQAMQVNILRDAENDTYTLSYTATRTLNIYMGDVNGSKVQKDGKIDLASSATTAPALIAFRWDPQNKVFYQMEGGVKYVVAFRRMTLTDKTQEVRMLAVPETELGQNTAALKLELAHAHSYAEKWSYNAVNHWHECSCGTKKDEAAHAIDKWTVEKAATKTADGRKSGVCTLCGQKIVQSVPMLSGDVKAPADNSQYYLTGVVNGKRYYFRHAPAGASVTDTTPYALCTVEKGKSNQLTVKASDGHYKLTYGLSGYHIYMNGNGVGVTSSSNSDKSDLVDFLWDEDNKLLYQMENGVKCVLVFQVMKNSKTGKDEVRITGMPMDQALVDPTVSIARFTKNAPPADDLTAAPALPEGAVELDKASEETEPTEVVYTDDAIAPGNAADSKGGNSVLAAVLVGVGGLALAAALTVLLKKTGFGALISKKWNVWTAVLFVAAAAVLMAGMLLPAILGSNAPALSEFTIVANGGNMDVAKELAVTVYEKYGISLPVVQSKDYEGNKGIYLDTQGINNYGGFKYSVYSADNEYGQGIYINGAGASLDTAIGKWLKNVKDTSAFPFGLKDRLSGYEWNTEDINKTGLGYALQSTESKELCEGVELRKLNYESFGYGKTTGYAVIVSSDANVELKVAAGEWDENSTTENPGTRYTVEEYGDMLTKEGYDVLAITNAGFFDLNTLKTYRPWGLQVVDGTVRHEPNEDNPNNTDNWFAQTADGKFVISNTAGYFDTYEGTLAQGVGGGRVLMRNGKPNITATDADYRTDVGITKDGDLIILTVSGANYAFVSQIFMDMDMDVENILNLDGGGSTTLHTLDDEGKLARFICETPLERAVADAIAIVKKK